MTLILGIRCTDGVIIGSDSAVTFGPSAQQPTIEQTHRSKIEIIDDHVIVAGTGALGLGQRFICTTEELWKKGALKGKAAIEIGRLISQEATNNFASTQASKGRYGALVAVPRQGHAELIEFDLEAIQPEVKNDTSWYAAMGAGQPVADPLLGFVRKAFWGDSPPNRQDGIFAATMVLCLAFEMAPYGVAGPIQMAILAPDPQEKGKLSARRIEDAELQEHLQNVDGALGHLREYQAQLQTAPDSASPPKPPST